MKISFFLSINFQFLGVKFSIYLKRRVFVIYHVHCCKEGFQSKIKNRMARNEPSHLDLHFLHMYLFCSVGLKG